MSSRSVTVEIAGLPLPVRTTASAEEVERVEALVNTRVRMVQKNAQAQPLHNHLALVALSLAQELLTLQETQAQTQADAHALARSLLETLDDVGE